ncbi:MAG: HEAT repeat domain-containing protein [Myxococcota bacterium]
MEPRELESIRLDLKSDDEEVRRLAVERSLVLPLAEALPLLIERLGDLDWRVRKAAVDRLATVADPAGVADALVEALADSENPGRRNAAVEALVRSGAPVLPRLLKASSDRDVDVRKLAVDALAGIADERASVRLLEMLEDPDPNVRGSAADALGAGGELRARDPLLGLANGSEEDPLVRLSALCALHQLEVPVLVAEIEPVLSHSLLRAAGFQLLGYSDEQGAWWVLLKGLAASSRTTREAAMQALLRILGRATPDEASELARQIGEAAASAPDALGDAALRLPEADPATRRVLIQFLGLAGDATSAPAILRAGTDETLTELVLATLEGMGDLAQSALEAAFSGFDPPARVLACQALGRWPGALAQNRLCACLEDPEVEVRIAAAHALTRCEGEQTLGALIRRLSVAAEQTGPEADDELATLGDALASVALREDAAQSARAVELLAARLVSAEAAERAQIARVLGDLGRPEGADAIALLVSDPASDVRRAAVRGLARISPRSESLRLALADDSASVRVAAAGSLAGFEAAQVVEDLACLVRDDDPRVRAAAVQEVARFATVERAEGHQAQLLELLSAALCDTGSVAIAAVEGLTAVGRPEAARLALDALGHEDAEIVQSVVRCLGEGGDADSLEYLVPLVGHPHWLVRAEAIDVLTKRRVVRAVPAILRHLESEDDEFVRDAILRALARLEE